MDDQNRSRILKAIEEEYKRYSYELKRLLYRSGDYRGRRLQAPIVLMSQFKLFKLMGLLYPELESIEKIEDMKLKLDEIGEGLIPILQAKENNPISMKKKNYDIKKK